MNHLAGGGRVIVVGAGIIGVAIAHHLSALGHSDVLVLDRGAVGEGTTAVATGGIRQQFTSTINATLMRRSVELFEQLPDATGEPFQYRKHGYLFLLSAPAQYEAFSRAVAMQNRLGIPTQMLDPSQVAELYPQLRTDDLLGATYCATDGSASPSDAVNAYVKSARRQGVTIRTNCEVRGFLRTPSGGVGGVRTADGDLEAEVVILAAGPHSRSLSDQLGVELLVSPHRRQAFVVEPMPWLHGGLPFTVDLATGAYIHPETNGAAVIGGNDRDVSEGTDTAIDWDLVPSLLGALVSRWPDMESARLKTGWAGLREMTPDDHALVGPVAGVAGFWVATGFSGHGFMQAPAIAETLAQLLLTGSSRIDISALRPERFAEGQPISEDVVF